MKNKERILVVVDKDKKLFRPAYNSDLELFNRLKDGTKLWFPLSEPRNPEFHKKVFALFKLAFENQSHYQNFDHLRIIYTMKAGYYDMVTTENGKLVPVARSLSFDNMSQKDFEEFFEQLLQVVESEIEVYIDELKGQLENFM